MVLDERDFPPLPSQKIRRRHQKINRAIRKSKLSDSDASINDLPDELILKILDYLPAIDTDNFQLPTLLILSLTCRRLHRMVADKIYDTYASHFSDPYLFLRTMVSNPQLGNLVQHADFTYGKWAHRDRERHVPTAKDKRIIKQGMRTLDIPNWKAWAADCNDGTVEIEKLHAAVLMHTPSIMSLTIRMGAIYECQSPKWLDLIKKATTNTSFGRTHQFKHLRSVRVDVYQTSLTQLAPLFRLHALRQLLLRDLFAFNEGERTTSALERSIPRACNNLEELLLEHSFLYTDILQVLFASSRGLKAFQYDITADDVSSLQDTYHELGHTKLITVLCHQKESLETLRLSCDARAEEESRGALHLHDGLRNFALLKYLNCPLSWVIKADLDACSTVSGSIPFSLVTFHTTIQRNNGDKACLGALEHIAASHRTCLPHLKELRIVAPPAPWWTYDWERLVQSFSDTFVEFVVEQELDDDGGFDERWGEGSTTSSRSSDEVALYSDEE